LPRVITDVPRTRGDRPGVSIISATESVVPPHPWHVTSCETSYTFNRKAAQRLHFALYDH